MDDITEDIFKKDVMKNMLKWKLFFSIVTIIFAFMGLLRFLPYDISLPFMFLFLGMTLLTDAKDQYDKGSKREAAIFCGIAIFVYIVTAYNLISRVI